jgi:hypothetical protein
MQPLLAWYACLALSLAILSGACLATGGTIEDARGLIAFVHDGKPTVEDWSLLLQYHDFRVPEIGILEINGTIYQIAQNGTLT